jgi:predicted DNA-binding transcriptional regulator AlpA
VKELRIAVLLGKLPDDVGMLIDVVTTANLRDVPERTLHRLIDEKAVPQPVRISGRILRWRLAELLEWIEAGCPHVKHWKYEPIPRSGAKGGR